ncbi:hypothetical protein V5O48_012833, partial [Marasmius crinis-equi]
HGCLSQYRVMDSNLKLACQRCVARGRSRIYVYYRGPFHDFAQTSDAQAQANFPDLIIGLNTSMAEVETESRKSTVDAIRNLGVPAVSTAYTKYQGELKIGLVKSMGVVILKELSMNKWRGVVPKTNSYLNIDDDEPIASYDSFYRYIIRGKA